MPEKKLRVKIIGFRENGSNFQIPINNIIQNEILKILNKMHPHQNNMAQGFDTFGCFVKLKYKRKHNFIRVK